MMAFLFVQFVEVAGWRLEIMNMDGKRVDKVVAQKLPEDPETSMLV